MDTIRAMADYSIRRACSFAGLGIAMVMLAFSYDLPMSLRSGGALTATLCTGLLVAAWLAPRRDMRRTELWLLLSASADNIARRLSRAQIQNLLSSVLRERLVWHAERVAVAAVLLWAAGLTAGAVLGPRN